MCCRQGVDPEGIERAGVPADRAAGGLGGGEGCARQGGEAEERSERGTGGAQERAAGLPGLYGSTAGAESKARTGTDVTDVQPLIIILLLQYWF